SNSGWSRLVRSTPSRVSSPAIRPRYPPHPPGGVSHALPGDDGPRACSVLDLQAHGAGRARDDPHGPVEVVGVEVGELGRGDLAELGRGDDAAAVVPGARAAAVQPGDPADERGRGRLLDPDVE